MEGTSTANPTPPVVNNNDNNKNKNNITVSTSYILYMNELIKRHLLHSQ